MQRMHNSLKEKILDAVDIVDVVGERVALSRKGKDFIGLCPFHNDHRPSFSVSPAKRIFKCWSCGAGGDVIEFVRRLNRTDFKDALGILAERAGIKVTNSPQQDRQAQVRDALRPIMSWACSFFERNLAEAAGDAARRYARGRGLTDATIARLRLGYAPNTWDCLLRAAEKSRISLDLLQQAGLVAANDAGRTYDRFRDRLIFPINDPMGRCVAFGGRTLGDDAAKYLNSPESALFSKARVLYGLDVARESIGRLRTVVVVEGYMDAVLVSQAGVTNVVATLGTALTDSHVKLLKPYADTLILCFDNDEAGLRAADRALETALRHRLDVKVAIIGGGKDPADCVLSEGVEGFNRHLQSAHDALEFKWRRTVASFGQEGPFAERAAVEDLVRFVAKVGAVGGIDPLAQGLLASRLSELTSLSASAVYEMLAAARNPLKREARDKPSTSDDSSAYSAAVARLPAGLVLAMEELFGLVLADPGVFEKAGPALSTGAGLCAPWGSLLNVVDGLSERSELTREAVMLACDDPAQCELISRAGERVAVRTEAADVAILSERVRSELDLLRIDTLGRDLSRRTETVDDAAYRTLLTLSRKQGGAFATDSRLRAQGAGAPGPQS